MKILSVFLPSSAAVEEDLGFASVVNPGKVRIRSIEPVPVTLGGVECVTFKATAKLAREAAAQLRRYAQDRTLPTLAKGTRLHCLAVVFKGKRLVSARQVLERDLPCCPLPNP